MEKKITFKDLNWVLKTAVIMAWIVGIIYFLTFFVGFIIGITGV